MENPIKLDDLGVPLFLETSKFLWQKTHRDCTEASGGCGGVQVFPERTSTDLGFQGLLVADF